MKKVVRCVYCMCLLFCSAYAVAAQEGIGTWTDVNRTGTYAFLDNNEFRYRGTSPVDGTAPVSSKGLWERGERVCRGGNEKNQFGNLIIVVGAGECCFASTMMVGALGPRLRLQKVWEKPGLGSDLCQFRMLIKANETPATNRDVQGKPVSMKAGEQPGKECPEVYSRYLEMEKKFGPPRNWQGCTASYD